MQKLTSNWVRLAAIAGVVALTTTGCSLMKSNQSAAIDPPQGDAANIETVAANAQVSPENGIQVTLYYKDPKGLVAPVTMTIPNTPSVAKKSLEYMVQGGPGDAMLPSGFHSLLPAGTVVKGMNIQEDKKLAIVDFSKEFTNYDAQDERKVLEAVTWSLTGFPKVEKVAIRVEGQTLKEMPVAKTPVDSELSRSMGINLEFDSSLNLGQSVPVTLYFATHSDGNYSYYVPVTRLIKRTPDVAKAAVEELIKGPDAAKGLDSVMAPETGLLKISLSDDHSTVTANFNDKLLDSDKKIPAAAAEAIILSLTETTGADKVQLMVNGDAKIAATDNQSFNKPVSAPAHINPAKM